MSKVGAGLETNPKVKITPRIAVHRKSVIINYFRCYVSNKHDNWRKLKNFRQQDFQFWKESDQIFVIEYLQKDENWLLPQEQASVQSMSFPINLLFQLIELVYLLFEFEREPSWYFRSNVTGQNQLIRVIFRIHWKYPKINGCSLKYVVVFYLKKRWIGKSYTYKAIWVLSFFFHRSIFSHCGGH